MNKTCILIYTSLPKFRNLTQGNMSINVHLHGCIYKVLNANFMFPFNRGINREVTTTITRVMGTRLTSSIICCKPVWFTLVGLCVLGWAYWTGLTVSWHKPRVDQYKQTGNTTTKINHLGKPFAAFGRDMTWHSSSNKVRFSQDENETFSAGDSKEETNHTFQPAQNWDEPDQTLQINPLSRSGEDHNATISNPHDLAEALLRSGVHNHRINPAFVASLSKHETKILYQILSTFDKVMKEAGLNYFLSDGSLLGSYRHHGIIPWDEDADVCAMAQDKDKLIELFKPLEPDLVLNRRIGWWKLFYSNSTHVVRNPYWNYPFLDIFFLNENTTHVWGADRAFKSKHCNLKSDIFPLTLRPLGPLMLSAPRNPLAVLRRNFAKSFLMTSNMDLCVSNSFNHKRGHKYKMQTVKQIRCRDLHEWYPFVFREEKQNGTLEVLKIGNVTLNTTFISIVQ